MTYVLIQWVSERKWDVYPISCIEDASVGYRLYTDKKCIGELRGTVVNVRWDKHKEPEPATLLDVEHSIGEVESQKRKINELEKENTDLKEENEQLKRALQDAENHHVAVGIPSSYMVDIGSGVMVEEAQVEKLERSCPGNPGKFARGLLRIVFSAKEMKGKSLFGRKCNAKKEQEAKEGLDPVRVKAVIGYTVSSLNADPVRVKTSLSTMLAREVAPKQSQEPLEVEHLP
ncbi:hypothetical protein HPB52_013015 [Rhipicephalus sanguineus]|uniref:BEN domain-containing protein n=1 Tax=Rhipicephalus sanguineus TaxID=34632 RepID=A0A9D4SST4_RHISA|nr:hypothetical protein HPB52_013015 [Rhipicephalus sanguineus]